MNKFCDWRKDLSVWQAVCIVLNINAACSSSIASKKLHGRNEMESMKKVILASVVLLLAAFGVTFVGHAALSATPSGATDLPVRQSGAPVGSEFRVKDGSVWKRNSKIVDAVVNEVPSDIKGAARYWSAFGEDSSDLVDEAETGVWFFTADGLRMAFLPLESANECQGVIFSPSGESFLLESGSGIRPDITYFLYELPSMRKMAELDGIRGSAVWLGTSRFVLTRIDGTREIQEGYVLRVSIALYDVASSKVTVLKGATDTKNFWLNEVSSGVLKLRESSVKSPQDWGDDEKTIEREITIEIPPAR